MLNRDQWTCQLCGRPIDPAIPHPDKMSAQVHHTRDRAIVGDDPRYLQAAHRICNQRAGKPDRSPRPKRISSW